MEIKSMKVDGIPVMFVNVSADTRHGFKHVSTLFINGREIAEYACHYLNRTWERYRYQTVMTFTVRKVIEERTEEVKREFKRLHGILRIAGEKRKAELQAAIDEDSTISMCRKILDELR